MSTAATATWAQTSAPSPSGNHQFVTVKIRNNSTTATITGPIYLEVSGLNPTTQRLFNSAGTTQAGKLYVVFQNASLAPSTFSATVTLDYLNPLLERLSN
jgi:hypothetical protein